ncbi:MAG: dephospho-CoA kinase [Candidatus Auribacterota bacterium]|jgi:dephospho-CoA kinase|nr:dephospho-CoA kinase [Candidatus Auribacterota bacterium]
MIEKPVTLAITGGIGSGKNTVGEHFTELGAKVVDSDIIVHYLYDNDEKLRRELITAFGPSVLREDGGIDRKKLAEQVFTCDKNLELLNRIVHPKVRDEIKKRISEISKNTHVNCIVVLVPLLIEANMINDFDKIILVTADDHIRIDRVKKRNGLTEKEIKARICAQMPDEEKKRFAHFVVDNNGLIEQTRKQIEFIYNNVIQ